MKNTLKIKLENYMLDEGFTAQTTSTYISGIDRFVTKHPNANKLGLTEIEAYINAMEKKNKLNEDPAVSRGYKSVNAAAIKVYYDYQLKIGAIDYHPCRSLIVKGGKAREKNFGSFIEMQELELLFGLKKAPNKYSVYRNKLIISLMINYGLTSAELVNMKVSDIDQDTGVMQVNGGGKNLDRAFKLKEIQMSYLLKYLKKERSFYKAKEDGYLIISGRGRQMTVDGLNSFFKSVQGAFDKSIAPLNIRNSVISHWLNERKIPIEEVRQMAGHRYISSTEMFLMPDVEEQKKPITIVHEKIFGKAKK